MVAVDKAEADFQERVAQMKTWFDKAWEHLRASQVQLSERQRDLLFK